MENEHEKLLKKLDASIAELKEIHKSLTASLDTALEIQADILLAEIEQELGDE